MIRKTSETPQFPFGSRHVCYIHVQDGEATQVTAEPGERTLAIRHTLKGEGNIYAVWPGERRSDLFHVDDITPLQRAWKVSDGRLDPEIVEFCHKLLADGKTIEWIASGFSMPVSTIREDLGL